MFARVCGLEDDVVIGAVKLVGLASAQVGSARVLNDQVLVTSGE